MISKAIRRQFEQAVAHQRAGRQERAIALLRQILRSVPEQPETLNQMGLVWLERGEPAQAEAWFRRATTADPQVGDFATNLGLSLGQQGRSAEALAALAQGAALAPKSAWAHTNWGVALQEQGQLTEALACFQAAINLDYALEAAHVNLIGVLLRGQRWQAARLAAQAAVDLVPASGRLHHALAVACEECGDVAVALGHYRRAVELTPGRSDFEYDLAARTGDASPTGAPAEYVARLFDGYAARFDEHLVGELGYAVPQAMQAAVERASAAAGCKLADLDVLDLGCGTGLCGILFRPIARRLVGVDLSPQMIAQARQRGCYDALQVADIQEVLVGVNASYDLVLAADVVSYLGDLTRLMELSARALRAGGLLAFSIEALGSEVGGGEVTGGEVDGSEIKGSEIMGSEAAGGKATEGEAQTGDDFVLRPTRRYAHRGEYVRRLANSAGLGVEIEQPLTLRQERGQGVVGLVFVFHKP